MNPLIGALVKRGERPALTGRDVVLSGRATLEASESLAERLKQGDVGCLALSLDSGPGWVVVDIACRLAGIPLVPVPGFFSGEQVLHVLNTAGVDSVLGDTVGLPETFRLQTEKLQGQPLYRRARQPVALPPDTARVTFTSGTTGTPKGVCLEGSALDRVADSLATVLTDVPIHRHLSILPLAVLLENVAGVYAGLLMGAEIVFAGSRETGLSGSSGFDPQPLIRTLERVRPDSLILLPQMLKALVEVARGSSRLAHRLVFVAVGGARTAPALIQEARTLGFPVYEGYGLSECASVVSLNTPVDDQPGSVGRVLPHLEVRLAKDGEIEVRNEAPVCYAGDRMARSRWLSTGDLGAIDETGFLHIHGRKKEVLVTSYGRNVSPEWVESELLAQPGIRQAMVFGDDLPALAALIVPADGLTARQIDRQVAAANVNLPDYARVRAWGAVAPFSPALGQLTANGRPRRPVLQHCHADLIAELTRAIEGPEQGQRDDVLPAIA